MEGKNKRSKILYMGIGGTIFGALALATCARKPEKIIEVSNRVNYEIVRLERKLEGYAPKCLRDCYDWLGRKTFGVDQETLEQMQENAVDELESRVEAQQE